jgi:hypothetical protein
MTSSRRPRRTSGRQALGTEQLETRAMLSGDGFSTSVTADDVAVDALGNTYLVGSFRGTVDFDPGAAVMSLTSVGARDGYLAKFDPTGAPQWVRGISSSLSAAALAVDVDAAGSVVVGGRFSGIATFDIDTAAALTSAGGADGFLAAYSDVGVYQWSEAFGGLGNDAVLDVAADTAVGVVAVGEISIAVGFSSEPQAFAAARTSAGAALWDAAFPATRESSAAAVALSPTGAVIIGGGFEGVVSMATDGSQDLVAAGRDDGFVATLDGATGATVWAQALGGLGDDAVRAVAVNGSGQIAFGGFREMPEIFSATSVSSLDHGHSSGDWDDDHDGHDGHNEWDDAEEQGLVGVMAADGLIQWSQTLGGESEVRTVAIDALGNVTLGGDFEGWLSADPTGAGVSLVARGREQGFVMRLDSLGARQWATPFDVGRAQVNAVALDPLGNTFVASTGGIFRGGFLTELDPAGTVIRSAAFVAAGGSPWHRRDGDAGNGRHYDWDDDGPAVPVTITASTARVLPVRIVTDNQEPLFLADDDMERERVRRSLDRRDSSPDLETYDFRNLTPGQLALLQAWSSYGATPATGDLTPGSDADDLAGDIDSPFDDVGDLFDDDHDPFDDHGDDRFDDDDDRFDDHADDDHDRFDDHRDDDDHRAGDAAIPVVFDAAGSASLTGTVAGERIKQRFLLVAPLTGRVSVALTPDARGFYPEVEVEDAISGRELLELEPHERRGATSGSFAVLGGRTYTIEVEAPEDWVTVTFAIQLQLT